MSVDNPEPTSRTILAKLYDAGTLQKSRAGGTAEAEFYYKKVSVDEALVDLENYYKAQAGKDMAEVIGEDVKQTDYVRNHGMEPHPRSTLTGAYRKGVNDMKAEQRKTAASKGYKVEGE